MKLRQLEYFCAVAEEGSVSAAARKLHVAQPPVSRQLALLEDELQTKLFIRKNKGVIITEAGTQLYAQSRQLMENVEQITSHMKNLGSGERGIVKIGILYSTVTYAMDYIRRYHQQYPQVELYIRMGTPKELLEELNRGSLHALFLRSSSKDPTDSQERVLYADTLELVMTAQNDPAPECESVPVSRLHRFPLCLLRSDDLWSYDEHLLRECARQDIAPNIVCHCYDTPMIMQMIAAGFGVGFLPRSIIKSSRSSAIYSKPVQGLCEKSYTVLAWKDDRYSANCVSHFVRMPLQDE